MTTDKDLVYLDMEPFVGGELRVLTSAYIIVQESWVLGRISMIPGNFVCTLRLEAPGRILRLLD
jgi:hypothetical protein